jgi:hypothetical protein
MSQNVYLVEGVVEINPETNRAYIKLEDQNGVVFGFDPTLILDQYKGQKIRVVISPLDAIEHLNSLLQEDSDATDDSSKNKFSVN